MQPEKLPTHSKVRKAGVTVEAVLIREAIRAALSGEEAGGD